MAFNSVWVSAFSCAEDSATKSEEDMTPICWVVSPVIFETLKPAIWAEVKKGKLDLEIEPT